MRTLKFKAWDTLLKKWNYNVEISCFGSIQEYKYNGSAFYSKFQNDFDENAEIGKERFAICQFTGLLDENEKEVYEGDIVKVRRGDFDYQEGDYDYFVIAYNNNFACWGYLNLQFAHETLDGWGDAFEGTISYQDEIEIIGNVFENKNLLDELR